MKTEVKSHATFSASGSERWLNCPGSIAICKDMPEPPETEYAAEGTKAHACLEFILKNRGNIKAARKLALKNYPLDMVGYALDAAEWIIEQTKEDTLLCETRVDATPFTCGGQFGTLDAAIVREFDRFTVIDFKYGAGIAVDPEYEGDCNSQLAFYALGISHQYHHNFSEVELVVIQPRAYHASGETIRTAVFTIDHLLTWDAKFKEGVARAQDPLAILKAGKWCRFCPAAIKCPELKDNAMREAQIVFSDETGIESVPEVRMMQPKDVGRALDVADRLEAFIDALRKHATQFLESGGEIPGWKLVQKRGIRRWADKEEALKAAAQMFWADQAVEKPKLLSPAQLEKIICKKNQWSDATNGFIEKYMTDASSGTTLVPNSDKRPAVNPVDVFPEIS